MRESLLLRIELKVNVCPSLLSSSAGGDDAVGMRPLRLQRVNQAPVAAPTARGTHGTPNVDAAGQRVAQWEAAALLESCLERREEAVGQAEFSLARREEAVRQAEESLAERAAAVARAEAWLVQRLQIYSEESVAVATQVAALRREQVSAAANRSELRQQQRQLWDEAGALRVPPLREPPGVCAEPGANSSRNSAQWALVQRSELTSLGDLERQPLIGGSEGDSVGGSEGDSVGGEVSTGGGLVAEGRWHLQQVHLERMQVAERAASTRRVLSLLGPDSLPVAP